MPKLHILSGVLEGKIVDLIEERITVGRALDNMIRLEDGTVSHHHAMFLIDGTDFKVRDLNSTNGTRVNGLRIVETKLHNGDQVRFDQNFSLKKSMKQVAGCRSAVWSTYAS